MRKLAPLAGPVMALALAWGAGCAPVRVPLISTGPLRDLVRIPQDATIFAEGGDRPILDVDEDRREKFEAYWYGPWERTEPAVCRDAEFGWAAESFTRKPVFGPNLLRLSASQVEAVVANARLDEFPSRAEYGIAIRNTSLRALPSAQPFYHDFRQAGEGYPFDYNQNSAVWAGTPLLITHLSGDGRYVGAESPYTCGWIDARDVAAVDEEFMATYRRPRLAALRKDRIPISGDPGGFLFEGRVGMLLPMADGAEAGGVRLLAPVADANRRASLSHVRLTEKDAAPIPFPFSQNRLAELINQIMGQPYGWGGLGGHRDCSSTVLDIFLPFGLPLPRNSRSQAGAGKKVDISALSTDEKRKRLLETAVPFRTLLNLRGHVMLYLGAFRGSPVAFHTIWGLRTASRDDSTSGRFLIAKSVITSLSPGLEIPTLSRSRGDLLDRIDSFTLLGEE